MGGEARERGRNKSSHLTASLERHDSGGMPP